MPDTEAARAALRRLLHADRTFADEPCRLRRALLDLLPEDDLAVRLLTVGAEVGIPALLKGGETHPARQALIDDAGLRPEMADWIVAVWSGGLVTGGEAGAGGSVTGAESWAGGAPAGAGAPASDGPEPPFAAPDVLRLAALPDGRLIIVGLGGAGVLAAFADVRSGRPAAPAWRSVAAPQSPRSRDVAVTVRGRQATVVWSDAGGVYARDADPAADRPAAAARLVVPAPGDVPVRHPIGALAVDDSSLDVFWSRNRQVLRRSTWRSWAADSSELELPGCCAPGEGVSRMDVGRDGADLAWLTVRTDRGRVLVSRWDVGRDDIASWVPVPLPGNAVDAAAAGAGVIMAMRDGRLLTVDAPAVFARRPAEPREVGRLGSRPASLATASIGTATWLVVRMGDMGLLTGWGPDGALLPEPLSLWPA